MALEEGSNVGILEERNEGVKDLSQRSWMDGGEFGGWRFWGKMIQSPALAKLSGRQPRDGCDGPRRQEGPQVGLRSGKGLG